MTTKPLSPAAQAVKDRFLANVPINLEHGIAAALRAMEDLLAQNWPEPLLPDHARVVLTERIRLFRQITAIAAELEGTMTDSLRDMPAYVREQLPGQWQGADHQDGPWRSIPDPQKSVPWQPPAGDTSLTDRVARAVCPRRRAGASPCPAPCDDCRAVAVAAAHEIAAPLADHFRERYGASNTADALFAVGTHQLEPQAGLQPIDPGQEAAIDSIARELRRPNV